MHTSIGTRWIVALALAGLLTVSVQAAAAPSPRVVNGVETFAHPTVGALLKGPSPENAASWCTGTMIGCDTFLTAAHCVCDASGQACQSGNDAPKPNEYFVFLQHGGLYTVSDIEVRSTYAFPDDDVAIIKLDAIANGVTPSLLPNQSTPFGTDATIVGYGRSGGISSDYGIKRTGTVTTESCVSGGLSDTRQICWAYETPVGAPGEDSNTCNGDSGGPMFADHGSGERIVGVTSGGEVADCLTGDFSWDTNLVEYLPWIESQGGADLQNSFCGGLAQVGGPGVQIETFQGVLDLGNDEALHSFVVPAGAVGLRVTMNASEQSGADFDLYVGQGSPPTTAVFDCGVAGSGQFGACEFVDPTAGTWHVLLDRWLGEAEYQVTGTIFLSGSMLPPTGQSRTQQKCVNEMNKRGAKVAKAVFSDARGCLFARTKGKDGKLEGETAQSCLTADLKGRVSRARSSTETQDVQRCVVTELPDFGYTDAATVNAAAESEPLALVSDVFGADLDAATLTPDADRVGARCQGKVLTASAKLYDAHAKTMLRAKKDVLRGKTGQPAGNADQLRAALEVALATDDRGRIAKAEAKLGQAAASCAGAVFTLADAFPGACSAASSEAELASCVAERTACRFCRSLDTMDALSMDCDLFDDGEQDASCP